MDPSCGVPAASAGLTVQVCFPGARVAVLDNLNRQREEGRLCDLSIHVQGRVFRAHRCVLAASSPYFHDQVLLKNVTTVSLPSVMDPVAFESVLSSAYTGQLSIVHDDIVNYVTVASFLQMWHIVDKCTEILKRPRSCVEGFSGEASAAHSGSASRQQSPSSTECFYSEKEGKKKEKKPDALPPLATWRRPQQLPRWGRPTPKPSSAQHLADSQVDELPAFIQTELTSCEESWAGGPAKGPHTTHDGHGHNGRHHGAFPNADAFRHKVRLQQRQSSDHRLLDRSRESGECDETDERKKDERRETEADEGVGDEAEKKKDYPQISYCDFQPSSNEILESVQRQSVDSVKEKLARGLVEANPSSDVPRDQDCEAPPLPPWQASPWPRPYQRSAEGSTGSCGKDDQSKETHKEELECFSEATYDEIEEGTGQVSQRPLLAGSPDFTMSASEVNWSSSQTPTSSQHLSPSSATFPTPPSPPTPSSSSSSVSVAGSAYSGKVHFCHCGKAYTLKSMRDRHVKMQHLNLRPFGCPVCTKSFKMKHHLTKHLKTHGGLRPYECAVCGKKVIWRDSFLRHQARCERLASSGSAANDTVATATHMDDSYCYEFEHGESFLPPDGQVKVEEVDFQREIQEGLGGLLGGVTSGMVEELGNTRQRLESSSHVFKEEVSESFNGT
ncbi:zinc finger and BTB domain-containing protein 20 [Gouania willdenowi]|uniref:zinc finger and BTB domain-containing protein 20 n=1 Tax=Gouania willdenowi TaxID=441366 RepID=UPI0010569691|nr:zinc finger and BTB domain-containing protein 20-like [Gouania willdenowi]